MKRRAHVQGPPLHPPFHLMMVSIPIACVIGALVFDLLARFGGQPDLGFAGYLLTFVAWMSALAAAVPGFSDSSAIPRRTLAKRDATIQLLLTISMVSTFFSSSIIKIFAGAPYFPPMSSLVLEVLGAGILVAAGWKGGTSVYHHAIGIESDPEERHSGRWAA